MSTFNIATNNNLAKVWIIVPRKISIMKPTATSLARWKVCLAGQSRVPKKLQATYAIENPHGHT
jgi:hypothetical protein